MRFAVTGNDLRFSILKELLKKDGHSIVPPDQAEVLIPPPWDAAARYARSETYLIANAALTAEGAAELLARERPLPGAEFLVLGYGRVGRLTAKELARRGAAVTVCARSAESRAWAQAEGLAAADTEHLSALLPGAEIIVNTVPAPLVTEDLAALCREDAVLLELASAPGGIDAAAVRESGRRYVRAAGLPGKYAPERAAAILRDAVYETAAMPLPRLGIAVTGSHCTFEAALGAIASLRRGWELVPILSPAAAETDTRFTSAAAFRARLEEVCGRKAITSIREAEPLGTSRSLDALVVAPCTGNTLAKLANGVTDTAVTMACKAHLRNGRPLVLMISTNDGLSGSAENIGRLLQRKNVYIVPFRQDAPFVKPFSLQSDPEKLPAAVAAAMEGRQLQPVLL